MRTHAILALLLPLCIRAYRTSDLNSSFDGPPEVFILGVQKAGTTALSETLVRLKVCAYYKRSAKEPQIFSYEFNDRALNRYLEGFYKVKAKNSSLLTLDASPNYFSEKKAFLRFKSLYSPESIANKKFILLLREPVARLFSWYQHIYGDCSSYYRKKRFPGISKGGLAHCVTPTVPRTYHDSFHAYSLRRHAFPEFGNYYSDLKKWLQIIPRRNLLILNSQALAGANQSQVVDIVLDFLGFGHMRTGHYKCSLENKHWSHCKGNYFIGKLYI